jgi:hypothetical protein
MLVIPAGGVNVPVVRNFWLTALAELAVRVNSASVSVAARGERDWNDSAVFMGLYSVGVSKTGGLLVWFFVIEALLEVRAAERH